MGKIVYPKSKINFKLYTPVTITDITQVHRLEEIAKYYNLDSVIVEANTTTSQMRHYKDDYRDYADIVIYLKPEITKRLKSGKCNQLDLGIICCGGTSGPQTYSRFTIHKQFLIAK